MTKRDCPPVDELKSFVRCDLPDAELESIVEHLEDCPQCEETVVGLEQQAHTIADQIRRAPAPQYIGEPECQQLLAAVQGDRLPVTRPADAERTFATPPQVIRDYELLEKLGEGGMGSVYKALHRRLQRTVAVKILPEGRLKDPLSVARFEREMVVLGKLEHPHIVRAFDAGEDQGRHYLVMEYVDGIDLGRLVGRDRRLPIAEACEIVRQAALALQYAHENGCVHRDIKPSNLMLATTPQGVQVKLLDLGLARALDTEHTGGTQVVELTTANQIMGTLDYMAPEQGDDSHVVDIRADLYSLGATLYRLLTGAVPHAAHAGKPPLQRLMAIAQSDPPPVQSLRVDIPLELAAIVHRLLAKRPEDRYATPIEFAALLEPFVVGADLSGFLQSGAAHQRPAIPITVSATPSPLPVADAIKPGFKRWFLWQRYALPTVVVVAVASLLWPIVIYRLLPPRAHDLAVTRQTPIKAPSDASTASQLTQQRARDRIAVLGGQVLESDDRVIAVELGRTEVTDDDLAMLSVFSTLEGVMLQNTNVSIKGLRRLPKGISRLDIGGTLVTDGDCTELSQLFSLQDLSLEGGPISDDGVLVLCQHLSLRTLSLQETGITDRSLAAIARCKSLQVLVLNTCRQITPTAMLRFTELPQLRELHLAHTSVDDDTIAKLVAACPLVTLGLSDCAFVTDRGLDSIAFSPSLETLYLDGNPVTLAGISQLKSLPRLKALYLRNNRNLDFAVLRASLPDRVHVNDSW